MLIITIIFLTSYCVLVLLFLKGWKKALQIPKISSNTAEHKISVIIPFRNEADNIQKLLTGLSFQKDPNFDVILVDDHSDDQSAEIVKAFSSKNITLIKNKGAGKKNAITSAVEFASGDIIVTTDADCTFHPEWLSGIRDFFRDKNIMMGFGGVAIQHDHSFFSSLQSIEFCSLIGSGAATAAFGEPTMCNGANLAYRKVAFEEVMGYEGNSDIASGDDEFLMRKIFKRYPLGVRFINAKNTVVKTNAQPGLVSFFEQRIRWAAKWRYNSSWFTVGLAIFVLLCNIIFIGSFLSLLLSFLYTVLSLPIVPIVMWIWIGMLLKAFIEFMFLYNVSRFLDVKWNWPAFIILQILYPVYVLAIGLSSNFINVSWKGRKVR